MRLSRRSTAPHDARPEEPRAVVVSGVDFASDGSAVAAAYMRDAVHCFPTTDAPHALAVMRRASTEGRPRAGQFLESMGKL
jgi:hypothetical protein